MTPPPFSSAALASALEPVRQAPALLLALSGGADSLALLHALVALRDQLPPLKAVHIHHGLQADADSWAAFCARVCAEQQVPLHCERLDLQVQSNIEQAARDARYQVFARLLGVGEVLLLAQHQDDQVETLALRILRGTGLRGLAGMPQRRRLGQGELFRPLLSWRRSELQQWLLARTTDWVDDPANSDPRFARSWLRHQGLPALRQQWPQTDSSLLRLAAHAGEANALLDELAAADLQQAQQPHPDPWLQAIDSLQLAPIQALSGARQRNLLRYWLQLQGCRLPDQRHLQALQAQLHAAPDRQPYWQLADARIYLALGRLWLLPAAGLPAGVSQPLKDQPLCHLAAGNGCLQQRSRSGCLPWAGRWELRYRSGGESIRLPGRPRKSLKALLQEAGLPAWLRPAVPLVYCDGNLVSVAGRWHADAEAVRLAAAGWQCCWSPLASAVRLTDPD